MTDWSVMSDEEIEHLIKLQKEIDDESQLGIAFAVRKAQAKHIGELADAVIVWMCYFASLKEREGILNMMVPVEDEEAHRLQGYWLSTQDYQALRR